MGMEERQWKWEWQAWEWPTQPGKKVSLGRRCRCSLLLLLSELHELGEAVFQHVWCGPDGLWACQMLTTQG